MLMTREIGTIPCLDYYDSIGNHMFATSVSNQASTPVLYGNFEGDFSPIAYNIRNFSKLYEADVDLGKFAINVLKGVMEAPDFQPFDRVLDIATGGGLRTGAFMAPLIADKEDGGSVVLADIGQWQLNETERARDAAARGELGIWEAHENSMLNVDPRWKGSYQKIGRLGQIAKMGFMDIPPNSFKAICTGHGPESATADPEEFEGFMSSIHRGLEEGGYLLMFYTVGSNGYRVGGEENEGDSEAHIFPAVPVYPEEVPGGVPENAINLSQLMRRLGFVILGSDAVKHKGDNEGIRGPNDPTGHWGLGVMVLQKSAIPLSWRYR